MNISAVAAGEFVGYGRLQGRYPGGAFGDTFLVMKRSGRAPNRFSQEMQGFEPGRLYSLTLITGDYTDRGNNKFLPPEPEESEGDFRAARQWAEANGVKILNASPNTALDVIEKVKFDGLF